MLAIYIEPETMAANSRKFYDHQIQVSRIWNVMNGEEMNDENMAHQDSYNMQRNYAAHQPGLIN